MKIKNYFFIMLVSAFLFIFCPCVKAVNIDEVSKDDQYVYCRYDNISYFYNATKGEFKVEKSSVAFTTISSDLVEANFVSDDDNKLYCPTIYKETSGSGRTAYMNYFSTKKGASSPIDYKKDTSVINNPSNAINSDFKTCKYSNYVFQLNTTDKSIVKIYDATGEYPNVYSDAKFDDIYSNNKCQCVNFKIVTNKREYVVANLQLNQGDTKICPSASGSTGQVDTDKPSSPDNNDSDQEVEKCEVLPKAIKNYIMQALKLIRWGGLVLMIVLGTLDFVKASASDDQDAIKKAGQNFIKRLIAVIILFLLPLLVELILFIVGKIGFNFGECYKVSEF